MNDQFIPQGALIVTDFDPSKGSEINKRRPALVISRNEYNRAGNLLTQVSHMKNAYKD